MTQNEIILRRLSNQQITTHDFNSPAQVVHWMLAMQAQDFAMAKWAVGLRLKGSGESAVDKDFNEGAILRTHLLRPTWHFVSPADIRWLIRLTAPKIKRTMKSYFAKMEMDAKMLRKGNALLAKVLANKNYLERNSLKKIFNKAGLNTDDIRMSFFLMEAELEEIICSGPRSGKQFTYALMDDRVPNVKIPGRADSLSEICRRFFSSRGPATIQDLAYWSGLTIKELQTGMDSLGDEFRREKAGNGVLIYLDKTVPSKMNANGSFLVPDYDEFGMSYKNSGAFQLRGERTATNGAAHFFAINGKFEGTWTKKTEKNKFIVKAHSYAKLSTASEAKLKSAIRKYETFFRK